MQCAWVHKDMKGCPKPATHWNEYFGELCKDHAEWIKSQHPTGKKTKYKIVSLYPTRFGNSSGAHGTVKP